MADKNEYLEGPRWYVVHTYSGYENKVKANIEKSIQNLHLEDQFLEIRVPMEEIVEIKDAKKKIVQKKLFPGYVLLNMVMNEETWYVVRNTRGVTGFVGPESKPVPLTPEEMIPFALGSAEGETPEDEMMIEVDIEIGDRVKMIGGVWADNEGVVSDIDLAMETVTVRMDSFSRETDVTVGILDVVKM